MHGPAKLVIQHEGLLLISDPLHFSASPREGTHTLPARREVKWVGNHTRLNPHSTHSPRFPAKNDFKTLVSGDLVGGGGAMNVFAGVRGTGEGQKEAGSAGGEALLELTPHRMAVCHLVQVFAPPGAQQDGGPAGGPPFPFESVAHHNRLGLFLFSLTRVRTLLLAPWLCLRHCRVLSAVHAVLQIIERGFRLLMWDLVLQFSLYPLRIVISVKM
jgi:hypothetical protein